VIDSRVVIRTKSGILSFATTNYKRIYERTPVPDSQQLIIDSVNSLIDEYQKEHSSTITLEDCGQFKSELLQYIKSGPQQQSPPTHEPPPLDVPTLCIRLWTSPKNLKGKEFCGILNHSIRTDREELVKPAVIISRGINVQCVTRKNFTSPVWPEDNLTYRGGGLPLQHRSFYTEGKKYRAPMFLATSTKKYVALNLFCSRVMAPCEPVLWRFYFHPDFKCVHVNYLDKSLIENEEEFLFSAYSVFEVRKVEWKENPTWMTSHIIELYVSPDNLLEQEDLPLAPWC